MRLNTQARWNSTLKKLQMLNIVQFKSCFLQLCVQKLKKKKISIAEEVYWHELYYFGAILCVFFMEPWKTPTDNEKIKHNPSQIKVYRHIHQTCMDILTNMYFPPVKKSTSGYWQCSILRSNNSSYIKALYTNLHGRHVTLPWVVKIPLSKLTKFHIQISFLDFLQYWVCYIFVNHLNVWDIKDSFRF